MTQASMLKMDNREDATFVNLSGDRIQRILGNVVYDRAFFFYEDIGKPIGALAISLSDFCNKISTIAPKSLVFHLKRGDFENWVREIIGDAELSQRIGKLNRSKAVLRSEKTLRNKLHATVKERIAELQDLWHHSLKWPANAVS